MAADQMNEHMGLKKWRERKKNQQLETQKKHQMTGQ